MKLLNSFWFVDVGRLLYNGPTISHFFINSRIKRWIDWKKWKRLMGGPPSTGSAVAFADSSQWKREIYLSFELMRRRKKEERQAEHQAAPAARQGKGNQQIQFHQWRLELWSQPLIGVELIGGALSYLCFVDFTLLVIRRKGAQCSSILSLFLQLAH